MRPGERPHPWSTQEGTTRPEKPRGNLRKVENNAWECGWRERKNSSTGLVSPQNPRRSRKGVVI